MDLSGDKYVYSHHSPPFPFHLLRPTQLTLVSPSLFAPGHHSRLTPPVPPSSHASSRYFARIARIFPPESIRTLGRQPPYSALAAPLLPPPAEGGPAPPESFDHIAHRVGTNLDAEYDEARKEDDPEDYLYTVQLMDEEHKFEGSFMEVKAKQLRCGLATDLSSLSCRTADHSKQHTYTTVEIVSVSPNPSSSATSERTLIETRRLEVLGSSSPTLRLNFRFLRDRVRRVRRRTRSLRKDSWPRGGR